MPLTRVQCSQQGGTGLPGDRYVNTFYVSSPTSPSVLEGGTIAAHFNTFYNTAIGSNAALRTWMFTSNLVTGNDLNIKLYHMEDPPIRVPFAEASYDLGTGGTGGLPQEVALCLSFKGLAISGVAPGRRRGRVYIGPLATNALSQVTEGAHNEVRPAGPFITALLAAGVYLCGQLETMGMHLAIHSPTSGPQASTNVAQLSVDNAFDTQRRRGATATSRAVASVPV